MFDIKRRKWCTIKLIAVYLLIAILFISFNLPHYFLTKCYVIPVLSENKSWQQNLQTDSHSGLDKLNVITTEPPLLNPNTSESPPENLSVNEITPLDCKMHNCFDYSRCSLTSEFPVYLYDPEEMPVASNGFQIDDFLMTSIQTLFNRNAYLTKEPEEACVFLVLVGEATDMAKIEQNSYLNAQINITKLKSLPYWGDDGRNHVLMNFVRHDLGLGAGNAFQNQDTGRSIIMQSAFGKQQYRHGFDVVVPPMLGPADGDVWQQCPSMVPAKRKYLLSFQGNINMANGNDGINDGTDQEAPIDKELLSNNLIAKYLKEMANGNDQDTFLFDFECMPSTEQTINEAVRDWILCGTTEYRKEILQQSTFSLLLSPSSGEISSTVFQTRLYESLRSGAIPVILGEDQVVLPYSETINWRRVAIMLPKARITELHFLLRYVPDADLLTMRRQCRLVWEKYFSTAQATINTIIAYLRDRLKIPPKPIKPFNAKSVFNASFVPLKTDPIILNATTKEFLGPVERPYPSPSFKRNYTAFMMQSKESWNDWADPFYLYPQLPFDPIASSDAQFIGSAGGFRPIGNGLGGVGRVFAESLGGNYPHEQFTIVMLTFKREDILMGALGRLNGLPYLHKVIVVWGSPDVLPSENIRWPDIGVQVSVVRSPKDSLNTRFLPFDIIETEAVLSLDDDTHLGHDEIIFAFRVWRENRDRLVGFLARAHTWNQNSNETWKYDWSNTICEYSMIMTNAAFFHKYYLYLYTYMLPQAIRDQVDKYMNCEDIAMNFLVSHITRKPPIKVTIPNVLYCHECKSAISRTRGHLQKRTNCLNIFAKIFGYLPLLNTQYRADSFLYNQKTQNEKKCFYKI